MDTYLIGVTTDALKWVLVLTSAPVLAALLVGLTVSMIQATTQIQEQTLTFVPKLVAVILTLALFGPWGMDKLRIFTTYLFTTYIK